MEEGVDAQHYMHIDRGRDNDKDTNVDTNTTQQKIVSGKESATALLKLGPIGGLARLGSGLNLIFRFEIGSVRSGLSPCQTGSNRLRR